MLTKKTLIQEMEGISNIYNIEGSHKINVITQEGAIKCPKKFATAQHSIQFMLFSHQEYWSRLQNFQTFLLRKHQLKHH